MDVERIRVYANAILKELPSQSVTGLADVITQIKNLMMDVSLPLYLSEVEECDDGYKVQTLGPHEPPHYEETIAEFYPGNHGTAPAELILLVLNNIHELIRAAEKGLGE